MGGYIWAVSIKTIIGWRDPSQLGEQPRLKFLSCTLVCPDSDDAIHSALSRCVGLYCTVQFCTTCSKPDDAAAFDASLVGSLPTLTPMLTETKKSQADVDISSEGSPSDFTFAVCFEFRRSNLATAKESKSNVFVNTQCHCYALTDSEAPLTPWTGNPSADDVIIPPR